MPNSLAFQSRGIFFKKTTKRIVIELPSSQDFIAVFRTSPHGQNHQIPAFTPHGRESLRKTLRVFYDFHQFLLPPKPCPQFAFHHEHLSFFKPSHILAQLRASVIACSVVRCAPFDHANSNATSPSWARSFVKASSFVF